MIIYAITLSRMFFPVDLDNISSLKMESGVIILRSEVIIVLIEEMRIRSMEFFFALIQDDQ